MTPPSVIELPVRNAGDTADAVVTDIADHPDHPDHHGTGSGVVAYDFRRPVKLSREHTRVLQLAFEAMARRLTTLLTSRLRQVCQVRIDEVTQQGYDEYVADLMSPSVTVPLALAPVGGSGTVHFSLPVTLAAIDHMLGGPGGAQPTRTLTDIEVPLLQGLLEQIVGVLRFALEPIVALDISTGSVEYNPQFLQAAGAADAVIVGRFELQIGQVTSPLLISLPLTPMLPVLEAQRPSEPADDPAGRETLGARLASRMSDVPLEVSLRFSDVALGADVVLDLAAGDVIPLGHRPGAPLTLHAGGVDYATAVAGRTGTRLAALVTGAPGTPGATGTTHKESRR